MQQRGFTRYAGESSAEPFCKSWCRPGISGVTVIFSIVVDVVTEDAREGLMNENLHAGDLVLTREIMEDLQEKFLNGKMTF